MHRFVAVAALILTTSSLLAEAPIVTLNGAKWLGFPDEDAARQAPVATRYFRYRFDLPAAPQAAMWLLTVDDAHVAYVNGEQVAKSDHWPTADRVDVTRQLRPGANVLAVSAFNGAGPGGFIAKLRLIDAHGNARDIVTDSSWRSARDEAAGWTSVAYDDSSWPAAAEIAAAGAAPWGVVGPVEPIVPDDDFPRFIVPGHEAAMESLRNLYWLHYRKSGPMATLWDEWLPPATLWPATGDKLRMRPRWAAALSNRHIDAEGYVSTHQHDGTAHADGWPFPLWHQGAGTGWHFAGTGVGGYEPPALSKGDGWTLAGASPGEIDARGWNIELTAPSATAQSPATSLDPMQSPFLRLNWRATGLEDANCYVEWTTTDAPRFAADRRVYFSPAAAESGTHLALLSGSQNTTLATARTEVRTMIPVYRHAGWTGTITGLRIGFGNRAPGAKVVIKSFHTAYDTRHNVNNFNYVRGVASHFNWTRDVTFLRNNVNRSRAALRYAIDEFQTRQRKLVFTPWVGHEGTTGVERSADGKKTIRVGRGIGANYWDLMPFSGEDALATIYCYDALRDWADVEQAIAEHPEWNVPLGSTRFDPADLRNHAAEIKSVAGQRFWNGKAGRFVGAIDRDGVAHDYGFTFLNTEAIYHGFATGEQARSIMSWISGERAIGGDTSTGSDIYHFRFGPRSTTRRNLDWYFWAWNHAESIPWGYQVQDGGAVLGWSYHDLIARLTTRGPDDAWQRLRAITTWFDDVQSEGGYRAYYRDGSRGTLQGNNTAGGLGMDAEFVESVLVPQVMLYGFLGFQPTPTGCTINPRLPKDWPSMTITDIALHDAIIDVTATAEEITVTAKRGPREKLVIERTRAAPVPLEAGKTLRIK